jgi:hypothetical protein
LNEVLRFTDDGKGLVQDPEDGKWYEPKGAYDADLEKLIQRTEHTQQAYDNLLQPNPSTWYERLIPEKWWDDIARVVNPITYRTGLSQLFVDLRLPDTARYFHSRVFASAIRQRLQGILVPALEQGDEIALIGHSMGTFIAYDVLWKLSRMSEYESVRDKRVSLFLTLGSPLGDPVVQAALYDAGEPEDGKYPANIQNWVNFAAMDDYVAYDGTLEDDFHEMVERGLIEEENLEDMPRIYTLWEGTHGKNPHKFYGYLNHPLVAKCIGDWITA